MYQHAILLHIVTLVMVFVVCLGFLLFILRPYTKRVQAESKRIAELLSSLPAEFDAEVLVLGALKIRRGADPQQQLLQQQHYQYLQQQKQAQP